MTIAYSGDNITFPDASTQNTAAKVGMVNRIINGAMVIDQRNAGASVTPTVDGTFTLDRFAVLISQPSKFSIQQNAGAVSLPVGFTSYLGVTSLSAYSVGAGERFALQHVIEGFNVGDMGWGTANAKTFTLSFVVYSSLTGTFGGTVQSGTATRCYAFTYSIPVANTWTTISVTIAGDTTAGGWNTNNTSGLILRFGLGVGSSVSTAAGVWGAGNFSSATGATSVVGTSGATFYITGIDLRKGSTGAYSNGQNDFDYRPYGTELALCQRYYQQSFPIGTAPAQNAGGTGAVYFQSPAASAPASYQVVFPVQMRTTPSAFTTYNPSAANANWRNLTASSDITVGLYSSGATGAFISSSAQVMNQYAISGIHYSATAEL